MKEPIEELAALIQRTAMRGSPDSGRCGDYGYVWPCLDTATALPTAEDVSAGGIRAISAWSAGIIRRDQQQEHFTERIEVVSVDGDSETVEMWTLWPQANRAEFSSNTYSLVEVFLLLDRAKRADTQVEREEAVRKLHLMAADAFSSTLCDEMAEALGYYTPADEDILSAIQRLSAVENRFQ